VRHMEDNQVEVPNKVSVAAAPDGSAAGVSLTHADASCAFLRQLADLSDDGMAKLKPTARLSPKLKRALVLVSDSSTALCKKNRRGLFLKADLDHEVNLASFMLGWNQPRYTMYLRSVGLHPYPAFPGLPYRDANVTTETVDREVRRSAGVLAALAGEPDIGFVNVIGLVEADLLQLHSAYNTFNQAMFEEFRTRNLQTQSASPLVEKLEMYDSFHASEDQRNRDLFQSYEHVERGDQPENPVLQDVFRKWREEKAPDAANAADITTHTTGPPMDKAIRKDVPQFGANTDVSSIADCVNDVVTQDEDGKVSYDPPGTVALVDDGDYQKSDRDEDALRRHMFIDESAPQGAATVPERLPNEYFHNGVEHVMKPFNPQDIVGDKAVCFKHGDLKFVTKLFRGHELDNFPLVFDRGCWTDVDAVLETFNNCRGTRWGIRQLLRAAKADNKGRIRLLGIDAPMKDTINQPLFPVRIRISQGHNEKLVGNNPDADFFLATRFYSGLTKEEAEIQSSVRGVTVLPKDDTPAKLYHRTNERGMNGVLRDGMVPGSARSNRSHNCLSPYRLNDTQYKCGMRSNQPIELVVDTQRAIGAGCVFFVTETDGVLTRDCIPSDCIVTAVDTSKNDLPLYVADNKEATREGEPGHIFRAKRDYEEAASSSSAPPPKQAAIAPKAVAPKPEVTEIIGDDVTMAAGLATRNGEPADSAGSIPEEEGDMTDAGAADKRFCKGHQEVLRELSTSPLATAAAGAQKPIEDLLTGDLRGMGDGGSKKRGHMSAEAAVIRDAKDRKQRSAEMNFSSVSERFEGDDQFRMRIMQEGRSLEDMQKFDHLASAVLPDPGRSEEQRHLRAGAHYSSVGAVGIAPAKLVFFARCEVEPLRALRFIDNTSD
ncbi:kptA, partial [Symbiodinium sp. CCMP2456]